eukprot:857770-Pyramimonas_sp.AAC.1
MASIGRPHNRNKLESTTKGCYWIGKRHKRDCFGKPHNRNRLERTSHGFHRKASQQEFLKAPQSDSIGLESATTGLYWKTPQQEPFLEI